jgi:hypothetical protein
MLYVSYQSKARFTLCDRKATSLYYLAFPDPGQLHEPEHVPVASRDRFSGQSPIDQIQYIPTAELASLWHQLA